MDSPNEDLDSTCCSSTPTMSTSTLNESTVAVEESKNCIAAFVSRVVHWTAYFWSSRQSKDKAREDVGSSSSISGSTPQSCHDDSFCESNYTHKQVLDNYLVKVNMTAKQIEKYRGPHFTYEFCSLEEECIRHTVRLEAMHVPGMDDFDHARKNALHQVKSMSRKLKAKAHSKGQPCPECELQSIEVISKTFIY